MTHIPRSPFLGHSLVFADGETMGEKRSRGRAGPIADAVRDTLREFPPARVSIEEFERDILAALDAGEAT